MLIESAAYAGTLTPCPNATLGSLQGKHIKRFFKEKVKEGFEKHDERGQISRQGNEVLVKKPRINKKGKLRRKVDYFVRRKFIKFFRFLGLLNAVKKMNKKNPRLAKAFFWVFIVILIIGEKPLWLPPAIMGMKSKVKESREKKQGTPVIINDFKHQPLIFPQEDGFARDRLIPVFSGNMGLDIERSFFMAA